MTRLVAVLTLGLGCGAAFADKAQSSGHVSDGGKYSVVFPAKPSKLDDTKAVATAAGNLTVATSKAESNGVVYSVTFTDYPESFLDVSPARILDGVVDGMKGKEADTQVSVVTAIEGSDARLVTISAGPNVVKVRLMLNGRRLYLIQACGRKDAMKGPTADEFLGSFSLTK